MGIFKGLLKRKPKPTWHVTLQLNAKLMPMDRGHIFEDTIDHLLRTLGIGEVDGGGSLLSKTGEIEYCDVEIYFNERPDEDSKEFNILLAHICVPKGSFLISRDDKREVGELEGLALYLNGTDLDKEVYETSDVDHLISELIKALGDEHRYFSYWHGPEETALYFYGRSFDKMKGLIAPIVDVYLLCQKSRLVQVA
jgi:hypothetical protein